MESTSPQTAPSNAASSPKSWAVLLRDKSIFQRGLRFAVIVGSILIAINHGDAILSGEVETKRYFQMALTVLLPYCVSVFSSISAIRRMDDLPC
ncbi:MAG: nitrate/nitrite transporter NrtS [Bacteroidota bacterium]|nr:nitrate/nitrite transporter NrtS [Bacteroidota bacterium]